MHYIAIDVKVHKGSYFLAMMFKFLKNCGIVSRLVMCCYLQTKNTYADAYRYEILIQCSLSMHKYAT